LYILLHACVFIRKKFLSTKFRRILILDEDRVQQAACIA
jgi:hypothetical protein